MSINYSFTGKRILVTGGAAGIGRQIIQRFSDGGAVVFTVDKNAAAVEKLRKKLPNVKAEVVDLTNWQATRTVVESFGKIDHLVNNAGIVIDQSFMEITEEAASLQFDVLAKAVINVTQVVAKEMIESGGGSIVNIASIGARRVYPGVGCYSAAKRALVSLTQSMALELGAHGIRVNCILPGLTDTYLGDHVNDALVKQAVARMIINQRPVATDEIADLVLFLLSPLSSMITGEGVGIDGGFGLV